MKLRILLFALSVVFLVVLPLGLSAQNKDWLLKMQDPNVNFWEVQKEFNNYWKDRTDYKGNGYKVFKRWEYINELRAAPDGTLPGPTSVMKEYARYMKEVDNLKSASGTWNIVGPTAYPSNNTVQPTGMGRVNAIAFHPTDANTIFIGSPSGGIWKTSDGGANWTNLSSNIPYLGVSAILIHPSDPNIIYIGTGDRDSEDAPGVGVYKSTDGGATWFPSNNGMGNTTVGMMLMHPSDPNTLFAATYSGIWKSTNGGASWTQTASGDFRDIKFKPGDPSILYATRMIAPSQFYRSTNTGDSWTQIATPTANVGKRMVIGVSPAAPDYVYLVQINDTDETFLAMLRSTDGGLNFSTRSTTPNIFDYSCDGSGTSSQALYDLTIEVDQNDAETVYLGSINTWKSTNGGTTWTPKTHWVGSDFSSSSTANCAVSVHADHHWLQWSPHHSPARLYLGHDGGIVYTADGGNTWTNISSGLSIGQIYKIGQSALSANTIVAGFQDNGVSATNNGTSFTTIGGGDGFDGYVDYNNPNYCYNSVNGTLRRSTTGIFGSYASVTSGITDASSFSAAYALHNTDPNTFFYGRYQVWRSNNIRSTPSSSVSWTAISTFAGTDLIRVMDQSAANPDVMYISRGSGSGSALYRSDNVNASAGSVVWNAIPKPNSSYSVSDIAAYPANVNIVFATSNTFVYKSTDKGATWTNITGNLPALFINCLVIDKDANEGVYIGNQTGVWYKDATMSEWMLFSTGLPPVDVRELEIYYDANPDNSRITAATYGRGVWQSDLAVVNVINPSNLAANAYSTSQINLSWALNASNNDVLIATSPTTTFGVPTDGTAYNAGNSLPGGGTVLYVGNLTNFSHTGLTLGTTYCYKIWSVNGNNQYSAGLTPVCAATFSYNWTGATDTDWFKASNWGSGNVPTSSDAAYIPAGLTNYPLINAAGATCYHLTIESGASVSMDATTGYTLQVTGDWTNNGTFNRGVGTVAFTGTNALQTIRGSSTTAFNILQVDKGAVGNILEVTSLITLNAPANPLVINSGTFKLSSASTLTPFTSQGGAELFSTDGIWNNGGTINIGGYTLFNAGLLKVTSGTINVGTAANHHLILWNGGSIVVEGGALNVAGVLRPNSGTSIGTYTQSGGTVTVNRMGSTDTSRGAFEINPGVPFTWSGGNIVVQRHCSNTTADVIISATANNVSGGTLEIGNAATPASQTIRINSIVPIFNLLVNATNNPVAKLVTNSLTVKNDATIAGGTLNANNLNLTVGGHWTNSGTFTPGTATVTFNGTANQNLSGSTATTFNNMTVNNAAGLTLSGSVDATVNGTLNLNSGVIGTGSNKVIIPASGTVLRTSGHIFGNLQKNVAAGSGISRTFEIGDAAAANYTPATVIFASVSVAGDLTAQSVSGDHPQIASALMDASKSVNRYWSFTNAGTVFTTYDAVFNFLTADLDPSTNTSNLLCGKYDAPNWSYPTVGTKTANSTEITGVAAFSDFQLAYPPSCINPDVPTINASVNPVCAGQPTTLSIASGNLNSATDWQWYSGSCGGTSVGAGTSIVVSPTTPTTYYVRGEGGCVTLGSCASILVSVNALPTPTISGPTAVCSGVTATLDAGAGYTTYLWVPNNYDSQSIFFNTNTSVTTIESYSVTVTDANGCEGTDTHMVTVNPEPTPTITGPTAVCNGSNASLDAGTGYMAYAWSNAGGSGQMANFTNIVAATTYTVTVRDGNNCQGTDTHTVSVNALPTPTISGPTSVCSGDNASLDAGAGYTAYAWSNGGGSGQVANFTNIAAATTYTVTVTDGNNCQGTDTHTISLNTALTFTACPTATVAFNTAANACAATATYNVAASGTPPPALTYAFSGATTGSGNGTGSGAAFNKGITTVTVTAAAANSCGVPTCAFSVQVTDNIPPSITCPTPTTVSNTPGQCGAILTYSPTVTDNCSGVTFAVTGGLASGSLFPIGNTTVQLQATDAVGLTATCSFTVRVNDTEQPGIVCPANIIRANDAGQCNAVVSYVNPTYSDNCPGAGLDHLNGGLSGSIFPVGTTTVTWMATDAANNTRTCTFTIAVNDTQAPNLSCPANQSVSTTSGTCTATVAYAPTASDNCTANPSLQHSFSGATTKALTAGSGSGSTFGKGITTVTLRATDGAGLTKTCTFRVIVSDTEKPVIPTCPTMAPVNTAPGLCTATVTYSNPTFTDNCAPTSGTTTRISGPASGSAFSVGTTNVTFRATDAASNSTTCVMVITVVDNQPPTISCPASVTATGNGTPCTSVVFYGAPTASDNCAGTLTPFLIGGLGSGSTFPLGTTNNIWRAVAPNGQTAECTVSVTVNCAPSAPGTAEGRANAVGQRPEALDFSLNPNPSDEVVQIAWANANPAPVRLTIYDVRGQLIWAQTTATGEQTLRVDVSNWTTGVYLVSLRGKGGVVTKRLVVTH